MTSSDNQTLSISSSLRLLVVGVCLVLLSGLGGSEARDKGEDIIMTKGKLIMRGGKGKGKWLAGCLLNEFAFLSPRRILIRQTKTFNSRVSRRSEEL